MILPRVPSTYYSPPAILALIAAHPPSPSTADAIRPTVTGLTTPATRGNASAVEGAGVHGATRPDGLWDRVGSRAGVAHARLPGWTFIPGVALGLGAALGWLMIALVLLELRHTHPALNRVRAYRAGEIGGCPL